MRLQVQEPPPLLGIKLFSQPHYITSTRHDEQRCEFIIVTGPTLHHRHRSDPTTPESVASSISHDSKPTLAIPEWPFRRRNSEKAGTRLRVTRSGPLGATTDMVPGMSYYPPEVGYVVKRPC